MSQDWNIRPYQLELLKILRIFESICWKHGFRYYADGGTALGAVRHRGFIPWDDDLDVNMPREDYNKFVKIVEEELPKDYVFRRGGETTDSPIYFSKIVCAKPGIEEEMQKATGLNGISAPFLDVFVLDGIPELVSDMGNWWRERRLLRLCQVYRYPKSANAKCISAKIKLIFARMLGFFVSFCFPRTSSNREMMELMDMVAMKYPFDTSKTVVEPAFYRNRTWRLMPKSYFDPAKPIPFEDGDIMVPSQVENFLERTFGNYMDLPPEEARIPEHAFKCAYEHL